MDGGEFLLRYVCFFSVEHFVMHKKHYINTFLIKCTIALGGLARGTTSGQNTSNANKSAEQRSKLKGLQSSTQAELDRKEMMKAAAAALVITNAGSYSHLGGLRTAGCIR